jgi:hypothetical protein
MSKIKIGIEIDEVLRAKWLQFDKYYVSEFGEEGAPTEQPYVFSTDYFKTYKWNEIEEEIKELKEFGDMPENINPLDYQVDEKTGEAPADFVLFKAPEKKKLTSLDVYNRFMYEDYMVEIFALSPIMYRGMDLDVKNFYDKYSPYVEFTIFSVESSKSIPLTLSFLNKMFSRFRNYKFINNSYDIWKNVDVIITTNPELLKLGAPWGKKIIKLSRPYNKDINIGSIEVLHIKDLICNFKFEKIIKYKNKTK